MRGIHEMHEFYERYLSVIFPELARKGLLRGSAF